MRSDIKSCVIDSDCSELAKEFIWSLRYSTHCHYFINNGFLDFEEYIFFNPMTKLNINNDDNYKIYVDNEKICFSSSEHDLLTCGDNKLDIQNDEIINCFREAYIYLISDFESEIKTLGVIFNNKENELKVIDHNSKEYIHFLDNIKDNLSEYSQDKIYRVKLSRSDTSLNELEFQIDNTVIPNEMRLLRAAGINIPLVVVQNLFKRKINTNIFVNKIIISNNDIYYDYNFERLYFDLDETLIWEDKPIREAISLLKLFKKNNCYICLLTRHEKNISETLRKIGLSEFDFDDVIKVEKHQMKSSFVKGNAFFIDNEYPQRFDVFSNTNTPSIDLDQMEFIRVKLVD